MGAMDSLKSFWPIISVAAVGLIAWGATTTTVASDNARIDKIEKKMETLDDRSNGQHVIISTQTVKLQTIETQTGEIKVDMKTVEEDVRAILLELRAMRAEQRAD